jgi:hypothetical protein
MSFELFLQPSPLSAHSLLVYNGFFAVLLPFLFFNIFMFSFSSLFSLDLSLSYFLFYFILVLFFLFILMLRKYGLKLFMICKKRVCIMDVLVQIK